MSMHLISCIFVNDKQKEPNLVSKIANLLVSATSMKEMGPSFCTRKIHKNLYETCIVLFNYSQPITNCHVKKLSYMTYRD